jgi:hypothetical protein
MSTRSFPLGLLVGTFWLSAQTESKIVDFNRHGWYSYSGDHAVRGRWGFHFDGQWRRAEIITQWQQYQLRPGLNFQWKPNVLLTLGYAFTRTSRYGEFPVAAPIPEHRIYQQALIRHRRKSVTLLQRYRLEQRWLQYPNTHGQWTYQNRFRYLLKAEFPLTRRADESAEWYLPMYNEILLGIPPNYGYRSFDQNRLFIGVGRSFGAPGSLEIGYLHQLVAQRNGQIFEFNNTLFIAWSSNFSLSKKKPR